MNALEAVEIIRVLDERIDALDFAYRELWGDFDNRLPAITLEKIKNELEGQRSILADKLRAVQV